MTSVILQTHKYPINWYPHNTTLYIGVPFIHVHMVIHYDHQDANLASHHTRLVIILMNTFQMIIIN